MVGKCDGCKWANIIIQGSEKIPCKNCERNYSLEDFYEKEYNLEMDYSWLEHHFEGLLEEIGLDGINNLLYDAAEQESLFQTFVDDFIAYEIENGIIPEDFIPTEEEREEILADIEEWIDFEDDVLAYLKENYGNIVELIKEN